MLIIDIKRALNNYLLKCYIIKFRKTEVHVHHGCTVQNIHLYSKWYDAKE